VISRTLKEDPMPSPITRQRDIESLKQAAAWPGADRGTLVVLAARLTASSADADGYRFFQQLADAQPGEAVPLALAGYFQARLGNEVDLALDKLDQAAKIGLGLPQYLRGLALASLPPDRERARQAVTDLEFVLAVRDQFPLGLIRAAYCGLAAARTALGEPDQAADAASRSGLGQTPWDGRLLVSSWWINRDDGFRFTTPKITSPAGNVHLAQGYDFADLAFITTSDGVVAIDAGTSDQRARKALADLSLPPDTKISHLILTHAHLDHVGGAAAFSQPGTRIIAQAGFPAELGRQFAGSLPFRSYFGDVPGPIPAITPDQLIEEPTALTIGGTDLVLYPTRGGETADALMIYLPASGLLFTGDVMMPYLGNPFQAEGSPEGLLETLRFIRDLQPSALIQGHTPLTETFTIEALPGLEAALSELYRRVLADLAAGRTLADTLDACYLPDHPSAVVPYLVVRDNFAARLHHQRSGYWHPDGQGLHTFTAAERSAALGLLAAGQEEPFIDAVTTLSGQGDQALALHLAEAGLQCHPGSATLTRLRQTVLQRLMDADQQTAPFRYIVYADLAGVQLGPIR
jgi:glyoxylase-like metal-dependent hydrolase (beta-lactamase superfamily II)